VEQTIAGTASNSMNIHEYQGKEILKTFGVGIQEGIVADTADAAVAAANKPVPNGGW
jgi:succinyl-CoA synthetase beta subunit